MNHVGFMASPEFHVVQGKEENKMEDGVMNSRLWNRFEQYCLETEAIQRRLQNGCTPPERRNRLAYRLNDLERRLIPRLIESMQRLMIGGEMTEKRPPEEGEFSKPEREALEAIWYIRPSTPLPPEVAKRLLKSVKIIP